MAQQNINIGTQDAKTGDTLFDAFGKVQANTTELYTRVNAVENATGWASYVDTVHISPATAFTIPAATDTLVPNNAGTVIDSQKPSDILTFYDGTIITGRDGDSLDIMLYFKAIPSQVNQSLDMWIEIGAGIELYRQTFSFPRGAGVERGILYALPSAYTAETFEASGGTVYANSNATLDIHSINYNFDRSHKAR